MAQRGEAGAEIVERDAAAEIPQRADEARGFVDVVERRGLGDLDHQAARDLGLVLAATRVAPRSQARSVAVRPEMLKPRQMPGCAATSAIARSST